MIYSADLLTGWPEGVVAVVAHDAGATRLLFSWVNKLERQLKFFVEGPAEAILDSMIPNAKKAISLESCLRDSQILISGTGWSSDLEKKARLLARNKGMANIAVLDHWVNYRQRFEFDGEELLPEGLWVSDLEAAKLAEREFPKQCIQLLPNYWLINLKRK